MTPACPLACPAILAAWALQAQSLISLCLSMCLCFGSGPVLAGHCGPSGVRCPVPPPVSSAFTEGLSASPLGCFMSRQLELICLFLLSWFFLLPHFSIPLLIPSHVKHTTRQKHACFPSVLHTFCCPSWLALLCFFSLARWCALLSSAVHLSSHVSLLLLLLCKPPSLLLLLFACPLQPSC